MYFINCHLDVNLVLRLCLSLDLLAYPPSNHPLFSPIFPLCLTHLSSSVSIVLSLFPVFLYHCSVSLHQSLSLSVCLCDETEEEREH